MAPNSLNLPTVPGVIALSPAERLEGKWYRDSIQKAMEYIHRDGLLVMDRIVEKSELVALREEMLKTSAIIISEKTNPLDHNHGVMSNFLQSPPLTNPALRFPKVYQNDFVIQIAETYLGTELQMPFITSNEALANTTERQPVHKDTGFVHPSAPFMAISN